MQKNTKGRLPQEVRTLVDMADDIEELWRHRFGWLSPDGAIHPCHLFQHLTYFENVPEFAEAFARYSATITENQEAMNEALAALGPDEHAEMHSFELMEEEAKYLLTDTVYSSGWVRLGMAVNRRYSHDPALRPRIREVLSDPSYFILEAEGSLTGLEKLKPRLYRISKYLGCELVSHPVRWNDKGYRVFVNHPSF